MRVATTIKPFDVEPVVATRRSGAESGHRELAIPQMAWA
jgi:hypothetical protein